MRLNAAHRLGLRQQSTWDAVILGPPGGSLRPNAISERVLLVQTASW